jgi:O-antigen/teichoic acid export membrane protein
MAVGGRIPGRTLGRNTIWNLLGLLTPLVIGVITIPFIVDGLGKERFGLLALAWVITVYFGVIDLGLGRAATKFVADTISRGEEDRVGTLVWTAVAGQALLGMVGTAVLAGLSSALAHVLNLSPGVTGEAQSVFLRLSLAIPFIAMSSSFRGTLEAAQRFGMINLVRVPVSAGNFLIPFLGVLLDWDLPLIVVLLVISQALATLGYYRLSARVFTSIRTIHIERTDLRRLFAYGGWVTVSLLLSPVLLFLDRFMLGVLAPVRSVAFYAAPYEMVTKLWLIPTSLVSTLFPAFSMLSQQGRGEALEALVTRAVKYLVLVLGPLVVVTIVNAEDVLGIWLGAEFSERSSQALQILAFGVFVNSLSWLPFSLLQAVGRADVPAKLQSLETPIHVVVVVIMVSLWGVTGAALAWTTRTVLEAVLMFTAVHRLSLVRFPVLLSWRIPQLGISLMLTAGVALAAAGIFRSTWTHFATTALAILALLTLAWRYLLTQAERSELLALVRSI